MRISSHKIELNGFRNPANLKVNFKLQGCEADDRFILPKINPSKWILPCLFFVHSLSGKKNFRVEPFFCSSHTFFYAQQQRTVFVETS